MVCLERLLFSDLNSPLHFFLRLVNALLEDSFLLLQSRLFLISVSLPNLLILQLLVRLLALISQQVLVKAFLCSFGFDVFIIAIVFERLLTLHILF